MSGVGNKFFGIRSGQQKIARSSLKKKVKKSHCAEPLHDFRLGGFWNIWKDIVEKKTNAER